jgi:hypothetical protein
MLLARLRKGKRETQFLFSLWTSFCSVLAWVECPAASPPQRRKTLREFRAGDAM